MNVATAIPAGYRQDAQGRLVPEAKIKPVDLTRDDLVQELIGKAKQVRSTITQFKTEAFADIAAFVQLSCEEYGVRLRGTKGNVTLLSFDGRYKVIRAIAETISLDERLEAAKELIYQCLQEWTADARDEVRLLVQDAFRTDSAGNVRIREVLRLRRIEITDERWLRAMQAIGEAVQVVGSKSYVRFYERDDHGEYQPIALDVAGA